MTERPTPPGSGMPPRPGPPREPLDPSRREEAGRDRRYDPDAPPRESSNLPRRPVRRGPRVLPFLVGLFALLGMGLFALVSMAWFLFGGFPAVNLISRFSFKARHIGVVKINRTIQPGADFDFWMQSLRSIGRDKDIKGVVVRIDSPGGTVATSQELFEEILELRKKGKTVYVSMGDVAASGGYYIAAAADKIFANRGTLTGSVGVISTTYQVGGLAEKWGLGVEVLKSGRFKDAGSMFRPMTDDERRILYLMIDDAYNQFLDDIYDQRKEPLAAALKDFKPEQWDEYLFAQTDEPDTRYFLEQIADGRVYTGLQAKMLGLVDELKPMERVIDELAEDLNVPRRTAVYEPRAPSIFDMLTMKIRSVVPDLGAHPSLQYRMIPF